ncbi:MAG: OmpA family protein [Candidatus Omnitrophica bacterium]|nr:OmpA family protein [Candidatus Omnitrophota bacterium]
MKMKLFAKIALIAFLSLSLSGCTFIFQKGRRSDIRKIEELSKQLDELNQARGILETRLAGEIRDKQVKLEMMEKGLVITVVGDIVFDSGKDKIRPEVYSILDKISMVLKENVPQLSVGIEGHTDNQPIQYSNWKSNWELSVARSLSVLHFLVDEKGISPERISAIGYGEYHPVASNDTKQGCQLNRRVEIVILPRLTKVKETKEPARFELKEPLENLK